MKRYFLFLSIFILFFFSCKQTNPKEAMVEEIIEVERQFQQMTEQKGIADAFHFFAAENAAIKRENDTLIVGRENIKSYYQKKDLKNVKVNWKPDFIDISESGDMAYTYGKYVWEFTNTEGNIKKVEGVFHTVWKKQEDRSWKYVWD